MRAGFRAAALIVTMALAGCASRGVDTFACDLCASYCVPAPCFPVAEGTVVQKQDPEEK